MNWTTWYRVILTHKSQGNVIVFATTKTREKAEDVAASLEDRYPPQVWEIRIDEEKIETL